MYPNYYRIRFLFSKNIVIEAKDYKSIDATGKKGLLKYLEDSMTQRNAIFGIACSKNSGSINGLKKDHGNGAFALFGNRILCEYGDNGFSLELAYRFARIYILHKVNSELEGEEKIDPNLINSLISDIEKGVKNLSSLKGKITKIKNATEGIKDSLDDLSSDIEERRKVLISKCTDIMDSVSNP